MKVTYILHSTGPHEGSTIAFLRLLTIVRKKGIEPTVIVPDTEGIYHMLLNDGVDVVSLNFRIATYPRIRTLKDAVLWLPRLIGRIVVNKIASRSVIDICRQRKSQLIHTNVSVVDIGYRAARQLSIPHIWHLREYSDLIGYHYIFTRAQQLRNYKTDLSYTVCITRGVQQYYQLEKHPYSRVIYDGAIVKDYETITSSIAQPFFLFAGRLEKGKGIEDLLVAYTLYAKQCPMHWPLRIAGDTAIVSYKQHLKNFVRQHDMDNDITFLGMRNDIHSLYAQAGALIMSSLSEGFGLVTAEAMNAGCLVIGFDTSGTKEQFDNGKQFTGQEIALRYTTQEELVLQMQHVTLTPQQDFLPMKLRAKQTVEHFYTDQKNAEQIIQLYQGILDKTM